MASREQDWLRRAEHDFSVARLATNDAKHDWACFASHQAAEKALKALCQHHHAEGWGHSLEGLVAGLLDREPDLSRFEPAVKSLDKMYIPTRYPNGLPAGATDEPWRDRRDVYAPPSFPIGVETFIYTSEELAELRRRQDAFVSVIDREIRWL